MNAEDIFQQGQLAEAAYGDFFDTVKGVITDPDDVQDILKSINFSETQADMFTEKWSVIAHQPNTSSGFPPPCFKTKIPVNRFMPRDELNRERV